MVHLHNGILHSRKKEGDTTFLDSMDRTGEHYAKWNKPVKDKYHMSISIDAEKSFDKVQYPFMKKNTQQDGSRGSIPQNNKGHIWDL